MGTEKQSKIQPWSESLGHLLLWSMMDLLEWIVQKPDQAGLRQGPIKVPDVLVTQTAIGFPASVFPKVSRSWLTGGPSVSVHECSGPAWSTSE